VVTQDHQQNIASQYVLFVVRINSGLYILISSRWSSLDRV